MDDSAHESESLWDDLRRECDREARLHHERNSRANNSMATRIGRIGEAAMQQTAAMISSLAPDRAKASHPSTSQSFGATAPTSSTANSFASSLNQSVYSNASNSTAGNSLRNLAEFGMDVRSTRSDLSQSRRRPLDSSGATPVSTFNIDRTRDFDRSGPYIQQQYVGDHHDNKPTARDTTASSSAAAPLLSNDHHSPTDSPHEGEINRREKSEFVFLGNFRRQPQKDGWGAVADLDTFFGSVYSYYYNRGLTHIVGKGLVELISLFFTLGLSVFLFAYLDWSALMTCKDEATCRDEHSGDDSFHRFIIKKPFGTISAWNFLVLLYFILFTCYGVVSMFTFYIHVRCALDTRSFYTDKLGISARKLEGGAIEWDDIVQKIMSLQKSGEYRIAIHGGEIDELIVAQRVMRKENFMVAFINRNMLDLRLPVPWPLSDSGYSKGLYLCTSVEWSLHACLFNFMFNHKYKIRPAFYMDPSALKRRFVLCGIAHAIFMPFLLFFMMLHFLLLNMYVWRSSKEYLGPREWSSTAKWTFREFNELPHSFERRLGPSYQAGDDYLKLFTQSPLVSYIGRVTVFVSGSLVAVLIGFAALNDSILLHVKLGQWNLLWYLGMLGFAFSAGKGMLPDEKVHPPYAHNLFAEMDAALVKVTSYTHYYPDIWKKLGWKKETQQQFAALFRYKSQLFVEEVLATILAPFVLCFLLPKCAAGDENWEGRKMKTRGDAILGDLPKTRQGKMEKSFFSFKVISLCSNLNLLLNPYFGPRLLRFAYVLSLLSWGIFAASLSCPSTLQQVAHPSWTCSDSGKNLVERIERYKQMEVLALARERQHHIDAAARQLETLRLVEMRKEPAPSGGTTIGLSQIDEAYVANKGETSTNSASYSKELEDETSKRSPKLDVGKESSLVPQESDGEEQDRQLKNLSRNETPPSTSLAPQINHATPSFVNTRDTGRSLSPLLSPEAAASVLHYADLGLSTELQMVLNRSTFDPGMSVAGMTLGGTLDPTLASQLRLSSHSPVNEYYASLLGDEGRGGGALASTAGRGAEIQYLCLERYHSHIMSEREMQRNDTSAAGTATTARPQDTERNRIDANNCVDNEGPSPSNRSLV